MTTEAFRPIANTPPSSLPRKVKFFGRMILDYQVLTVYQDLHRELAHVHGDVLDVGCGYSPYKFLLEGKPVRYFGIDVQADDTFGDVESVVPFDGMHIPFPDDHFDFVICTEVLEHVSHFQELVDELHRVMKVGSRAFVTVPWSARYHFIPYDFFRYTPSSLGTIFGQFRDVTISPRGTDISVIASKVAVLWFRNLVPQKRWKFLFTPLWLLASPLLLVVTCIGHIATYAKLGSTDDPLGYTITASK